MRFPRMTMVAVSLLTMLAAGCARDMKGRLASDEAFATQVMEAYRSDGALAGRMMDNLLASDSTQAVVIERVFASGPASQALMMRIARDRNMMNGVIALAAQDPQMRANLLTLLKGIEIGNNAPR